MRPPLETKRSGGRKKGQHAFLVAFLDHGLPSEGQPPFYVAMHGAQNLADQSGVTMQVLDSNGYSLLRSGHWVVYVGKMNRGDVREHAQIFRNLVYDAYAQEVSGWDE